MSEDESRFVYLYLSTKGNSEVPVYVGRGTAGRVEGHGVDDSNSELASVIAGGEYAIEVLDCHDSKTAIIVEGALISAMRGRSKVALTNGRQDQHVFTPLGVPLELSSRRGLPALTPTEVAELVEGRVLFVRVGPKGLNSLDRGVIDPGKPEAGAVADRLRRWWQIAPWISQWVSDPAKAPCVLVGIAGTKHRYIVGAIDLRSFDWNSLDWTGRSASFPLDPDNAQLDGFDLRGRTILDGAIFGRASWELAQVYDPSGCVERPES